ncbi:hypothetical protein Mapa_000723 [Marchantia paleacea]|nr:hypothetical protein Mapa_000723 [Marchantia paleacea]
MCLSPFFFNAFGLLTMFVSCLTDVDYTFQYYLGVFPHSVILHWFRIQYLDLPAGSEGRVAGSRVPGQSVAMRTVHRNHSRHELPAALEIGGMQNLYPPWSAMALPHGPPSTSATTVLVLRRHLDFRAHHRTA